jgi:hypothetical protein
LDGKNHTPIFDGGLMFFDGSFDGNGYTIRNMTVDAYHPYPSLFGCIGGGSIKNLNIEDFEIIVPNFNTSEYALFVGAVCGDTRGTLANISVSGRITAARIDYNYIIIGGLVGRTMNMVTNCHADIVIELNNVASGGSGDTVFIVGGLVGQSVGMAGYTKIDLTGCDAAGYIDISYTGNKAGRVVGGLAGTMDYYKEVPPVIDSGNGPIGVMPLAAGISASVGELNIINCYAEVDITCDYETDCGGLIGYVLSELECNLINCYATGNITVEQGCGGGLLFSVYSGGGMISNCYATGNVTADVGGGFAHDLHGGLEIANEENERTISSIDVVNCYAIGNLFCDSEGAGFVVLSMNVNYYCSYTTGNIRGGTSGAGFASIISMENGFVEECFSTGNVTAGHEAAGFIMIPIGFTIKNCYSKSDIYITGMWDFSIGGFVYNNNSTLINCYYTGMISGPPPSKYDFVGAFVGVNAQTINCHYLKYSESMVIASVGYRPDVLSEGITAYDDISDMYELADTLNADMNIIVWIDISDDTPQLEFIVDNIKNI